MKIRVSNLPRVLYKDHYENKKDHYVKPARVLYKDHYENNHYKENKGVKPAPCFI